ncbi:hypothetical protein Bhyg_12967, partial [Pseudolycoriella hygida]
MVGNKSEKPKSFKAVSSSVIETVQAFYERDDISRISPNVKDYRKFVNSQTGEKEYKQMRFLTYKLSDVYELFIKHIVQNDCEDAKHTNGETAVLQIDFAENADCIAQDEIQTAHWNQATV